MAAVSLFPDDLTPFADIDQAKAEAMIEDAMARAARVAPCLLDETLSDTNAAAAKAVIRDAILRRNEAGVGAVQQQTAGPFSQTFDNRQPRRVMFWPSEIAELQSICADHNGDAKAGAFTIDTSPAMFVTHGLTCALRFGADYCSCGADIAGFPLYG